MAEPHWGPVKKHPQQSSARPSRRSRTWAIGIGIAIGTLALLSIVGLTTMLLAGYASVRAPEPNAAFKTATTFVYYSDGKTELGSFAIQNRQPITLQQMPDSIKNAVISAENRSFWTDRGISVRGMARAAWLIMHGGTVQGGSTITQQ
ncbi:MAG: putative penicillin binding protein, partial [Actinomycetia bacterium]|nr:putative penicillin binding protein [Actinomycetes bacterium]